MITPKPAPPGSATTANRPAGLSIGGAITEPPNSCPFETAAGEAPEIVCQLHLGLAVGISEATGGAVAVTDLVARDPRRAGCRLKLERLSHER